MNQEIKRRAFLSGIVATLAVSPLAMRYFRGKSTPITSRDFGKEFEHYEKIVNIPIQPTAGPERFSVNLAPAAGAKWKYVFLTPSYFQENFSQSSFTEPEVFHVKEGALSVAQAPNKQLVFLGKDDFSRNFFPTNTEELPPCEITALVQDGRIYPAQEKDSKPETPQDTLFPNILTLQDTQEKELTVGTRWTSNFGRIKPFRGYLTNYEILGISKILSRKAVQVKFDAEIPNLAAIRTLHPEKTGKNENTQQKHNGNAWFDLETGLLIRQEAEIRTEIHNVPGSDRPITICTKFTIQLFRV